MAVDFEIRNDLEKRSLVGIDGLNESSFAYKTIKDRLPVILAKVADFAYRKKDDIKERYGEDAGEDLKAIAGAVSKLRNEVMTNKPVIPLQDSRSDTAIWNKSLIEEIKSNGGEDLKWFESPWLYLECYMYRRLQETVESCNILKTFDLFEEDKKNSFMSSQRPIITLLMHLMTVSRDMKEYTQPQLHNYFTTFIKIALWGNKCDLSISGGSENAQKSDPLQQIEVLEPQILIDQSEDVWNLLVQHQAANKSARVDIILDNAGFELITDLCLAEFLLAAGLASEIHLHAKAIPWFVSDVTLNDIEWTLGMLCASNNMAMSRFGNKWRSRLKDNTWILKKHDFWTEPFSFNNMNTHAPDLYSDLNESDLAFYKGDLNYRKLVGDLNWTSTCQFETALQGFHASPVCALRALKSDVVAGLKTGQAQELDDKDANWMESGNWGVVSFCGKKS